ncbi:MAG TPA: penicillin-binding transpeptidase domain-containing protein, partial [Anaerolineales bacterium]|nr:penicillin-binding transpeptidase domain-containing protein [Anaerolineales bacterium]
TVWPTRGIIYDKDGNTLSANTRAVALNVVPSSIEEDQGDQVLSVMQAVSTINAPYWSAVIFDENNPFVIPLYEVPYSTFEQFENRISRHYNAIGATAYTTRLDYIGEAGGHSVGWVGPVPAEDVQFWAEKGYPSGAQIGRSGIEAWAEEMLAGKPSADLYVVTPENLILTRLSSRETVPSQSVYSTLDDQLQLWAQLSLQGFTGAAVVLERDTGKVLAIASSPAFNPNYADVNNPNSLWGDYFPDTQGYFFNRATQGQYPPGSIFKVVTTAAALESGRFEPTDVLECAHHWYGPDNTVLDDWTFEKERSPSGNLTLVEGLMRSCNIWFYQIGYSLYTNGDVDTVAEMARGFGLGQPTGIDVFPEEDGQITNPDNQEDGIASGSQPWYLATVQGIGQSDTLITPLQAAVYTAAIGNGGTLYRPQMIDRVENTAGDTTFEFTPVVNGTLPVSDSTLAAIREGMLLVTQNTRGTAYNTFVNRAVRVYGKTGTAQTSGGQDPHAWFIGFTDEQNPNQPDIAIAVIVEHQGDGSEFAAPIFRRLMEVYFYGQPTSNFPWESRIGEINEKYFLTPEELEALEQTEDNNNDNN